MLGKARRNTDAEIVFICLLYWQKVFSLLLRQINVLFSWKTPSVTCVFSCIAKKKKLVLQWEQSLSSFRCSMMSRGFCYWHLSCPHISWQDSLLCMATSVLEELSGPSHQHKGMWLLSPGHTWVCLCHLFKMFWSRTFFHFTGYRAGSKHAHSSADGSERKWTGRVWQLARLTSMLRT